MLRVWEGKTAHELVTRDPIVALHMSLSLLTFSLLQADADV